MSSLPLSSGHDPKLAAFGAMIGSLALQAKARQLGVEDASGSAGASRRQPVWDAISRAKSTGEDAHWEFAMDLLAQAALDNRRPEMVAGTALSSILRAGHDVPFEALARLAGPIVAERESEARLGPSGYEWDGRFPMERAAHAWEAAKRAASLCDPAPTAARPRHPR